MQEPFPLRGIVYDTNQTLPLVDVEVTISYAGETVTETTNENGQYILDMSNLLTWSNRDKITIEAKIGNKKAKMFIVIDTSNSDLEQDLYLTEEIGGISQDDFYQQLEDSGKIVIYQTATLVEDPISGENDPESWSNRLQLIWFRVDMNKIYFKSIGEVYTSEVVARVPISIIPKLKDRIIHLGETYEVRDSVNRGSGADFTFREIFLHRVD